MSKYLLLYWMREIANNMKNLLRFVNLINLLKLIRPKYKKNNKELTYELNLQKLLQLMSK